MKRVSIGYTVKWPLRPRILVRSSVRKPFITLITTISVATPIATPIKVSQEMTEMNASLRRARR
jgi:hypothetical protein